MWPLSSIRIDGSTGEGGGQILRTALALSAVTLRPLTLTNIRKKRKNPGLGNQHLACARALAQVTEAEVVGDRFGSLELQFSPKTIRTGEFTWDVAEERGSAGSVTLILQALLPVLGLAAAPTTITLKGGTHVPLSPSVHYLKHVFLPMLGKLGMDVQLELSQAGWYPRGGGEVRVSIKPAKELRPQRWINRGNLEGIIGWSLVSNLPLSIAERQREAALKVLRQNQLEAQVTCEELPAKGQGTCLALIANFEETLAGFDALGKPGKPAEAVGKEAAKELLEHLKTDAALDPHLADQVVIFLALAALSTLPSGLAPSAGPSEFTTAQVTQHLLTNVWTLQQCLPLSISVEGSEGQPGRVRIEPIG